VVSPLGFSRKVDDGRQNRADDYPQKLVPVEKGNTAERRFSPVEQGWPQNKYPLHALGSCGLFTVVWVAKPRITAMRQFIVAANLCV
jgi:hypothetical protein